MTLRAAALALLLLWLAAPAGSAPDSAPASALSDGRYAMGTVLEVTLYGPEIAVLEPLRDRIFARAEQLDGLLSRHREDSDVGRLNAAGGAWVAVAPEVAGLLRASIGHATRTHGSFDVTVGPLVSLWTRAAEADRMPSDADVAGARERVGAARIRVAPDDARVSLEPGASVDLGGIAKGYALDRMLPLLRDAGVTSALLSFGQSSVWAVGAPPDGPGWRLLARAPEGGFAGIVVLRDRALSVSGSLGQWSEIEGQRFGHVLDPRSGWPLRRRREAIVVAPEAELAEVLSKALLVLGEQEGIALVAEAPDCEALLLDADGRRWSTPGWLRATAFEPVRAE